MKYTSAQAAKLIRTLNEELDALSEMEEKSSAFTASLDENIEDVRPQYDFLETRKKECDLMERIRKVKHAVNLFNAGTVVPGFDMTIDRMLVYIPQLNERKRRLSEMALRLPKERNRAYASAGNTVIEYTYANYDVEEARRMLAEVTDTLAKAQTALDELNNSVTFEIEV